MKASESVTEALKTDKRYTDCKCREGGFFCTWCIMAKLDAIIAALDKANITI
jgi:hypothetical protein